MRKRDINLPDLEEHQAPTSKNSKDHQWWAEKGGRQVRGLGLLELLGRIHVFNKQIYCLLRRAPQPPRSTHLLKLPRLGAAQGVGSQKRLAFNNAIEIIKIVYHRNQ